jgi:hypothetical protein
LAIKTDIAFLHCLQGNWIKGRDMGKMGCWLPLLAHRRRWHFTFAPRLQKELGLDTEDLARQFFKKLDAGDIPWIIDKLDTEILWTTPTRNVKGKACLPHLSNLSNTRQFFFCCSAGNTNSKAANAHSQAE